MLQWLPQSVFLTLVLSPCSPGPVAQISLQFLILLLSLSAGITGMHHHVPDFSFSKGFRTWVGESSVGDHLLGMHGWTWLLKVTNSNPQVLPPQSLFPVNKWENLDFLPW